MYATAHLTFGLEHPFGGWKWTHCTFSSQPYFTERWLPVTRSLNYITIISKYSVEKFSR